MSRHALPGKGLLRRWFSADGWKLGIDRPVAGFDPIVADLQDAVLLQEHAPLLDTLAAWWQHSHDWAPVSRDRGTAVHLTFSSAENHRFYLVLSLPDEKLKNAPELPEALSTLVQPAWHKLPSTLRLNTHQISEEDRARLKPGSLMLLDCSYGTRWPVQLVIDSERTEYDAVLAPSNGQISVESQLPRVAGAYEGVVCDVYLDQEIITDVAKLESDATDLSVSTLCSAVHLMNAKARVTFQGCDQSSLTGDIVPLGQGYAVRLHAQ